MPTLDTYRKQAKLLMRWHRDRDYSIGGRVRVLDRFKALTDREILAMKFPLTLAQEIVAVEAGHGNWAALKAVAVDAPKMPAASSEPPVFKSVIPILFVRDVIACAAFFREKLGFAAEFLHGAPPFYGAVSRDGIWIHLRLVQEPYFAAAAAKEKSLILASIEVSNVQALFEEFKAKGVEFAQPLMKQAWGGTDFHVRDPDGNVISFVAFRS
ncbi:glyoxalase/bleomycin resistance/extradiol dioxygenase family protein [Rhizobium lusitanum]|uniref:Glyoxalase/bleomycin resistance/extradiol dioxygenase family protein n=1 Tax=Rhizobium lusitanum TaxID=293958 RepID=A0A6L9U806_9HYPH|nr:glyoxalase superfamily protein [Rhizobium lusitanum]NEI71479.1 glyoxalase/bleomycin resistance/extradiol dioxygenase family protein [Rhizobium lusitanum]